MKKKTINKFQSQMRGVILAYTFLNFELTLLMFVMKVKLHKKVFDSGVLIGLIDLSESIFHHKP